MEKACHLPAGRAYLFDMDGTLVDNCSYHVKSWLAFANRHGKSLTETQILDWMKRKRVTPQWWGSSGGVA